MKVLRNQVARGAAFLELAIILPLLILLVFGALEFSLAASEYKTLAKQTRIGARYLSSRAPGDEIGQAQAICLVRTGIASNAPCSGNALTDGLASAIITVQDSENSTNHRAQQSETGTYSVRVNLVTVTVSGYQYEPLIGGFLSGLAGPSTITFDPVSATMRQAL